MYRTVVLGGLLVVCGVLWVTGGCGSPQSKGPPKSPPSSPATPGKTSETEGESGKAAMAAETEPLEGLKELSAEDRAAAEKQRICPVSGELLGAMGKPYKVTVQEQTVFLCCQGCEETLRKNPEKYLAKLKK